MVESIYFLKPACCGSTFCRSPAGTGLTARYKSHRLEAVVCHLRHQDEIPAIRIDRVLVVASKIEEQGRTLKSARKDSAEDLEMRVSPPNSNSEPARLNSLCPFREPSPFDEPESVGKTRR
jgi:hypothetical protein